MKVLLVGATGVLGSRLYIDLKNQGWKALGTYCEPAPEEGMTYLDLRDREGIEKTIDSFDPDIAILSGGVTNVDLCESEKDLAEDINVEGSIELIKKIKERNKKIVFLSTDYVFDGKKGPYREEDIPSPLNIYGMTKLKVENEIKKRLNDYLIIRTAQLFGKEKNGVNFSLKIINNMRSNKKVYAAEDFYCTPTYVGDLSLAIIKLIESRKNGTYHVAGTDFINRVEFIEKIANIFNLNKDLIEKVSLKDLKLKAKRPKKAGLCVEKIKKELDVPVHTCNEGLKLLREEMEL
ncbi:MAG: SDR family oxidoreductase [Candidatus Omnitrophota bacterium]